MLTGFGRGAHFAIRLPRRHAPSFDARVYNQTSSHCFWRSWVLGERHIAKALSNDAVPPTADAAAVRGHRRRWAAEKILPRSPWGTDGGQATGT